jgi:hypothetical protein
MHNTEVTSIRPFKFHLNNCDELHETVIRHLLEVCGRIRSGTVHALPQHTPLPHPEIQCHHISPQRLITHTSKQTSELITTYKIFLVTCTKSQNAILWSILSKKKSHLNIRPIINRYITMSIVLYLHDCNRKLYITFVNLYKYKDSSVTNTLNKPRNQVVPYCIYNTERQERLRKSI